MKKRTVQELFSFSLLLSMAWLGLETPVHGQPADSPWPMFRHDLQRTGSSPFRGPETAELKWTYETEDIVHSSPAIGSDGTVYIASTDGHLYAVHPDGSLKWKYETGSLMEDHCPAIGSDGTVYVGSSYGLLYALRPDGSLRWKYETGGQVSSSPAIGSDGTVYVGVCPNCPSGVQVLHQSVPEGSRRPAAQQQDPGSPNLFAVNPDGSLKWQYETGKENANSAAIGTDGTIYVASYQNGNLYAIDTDGSLKWTYGTGGRIYSCPVIGSDGTVYVGSYDKNLYALHPDGTLKWEYETGGAAMSHAIGADGTVYVGSEDSNLYAIHPDGSLKWKYKTGYRIWSTPAIGSDGTVYVGSWDNSFYAILPDGSLQWKYETGGSILSSPAIGSDGAIYVGSSDHRIYAFLTPEVVRHLRARVVSATATPSAPRAGQPTPVEVAVVLDAPLETTGSAQRVILDLSSLGIPDELPLDHVGGGRYTLVVELQRSGRHDLPVLLETVDGARHLFLRIPLTVWPTVDLVVFDEEVADGVELSARGIEHLDPDQTELVFAGNTACAVQGKKSFAGWTVGFPFAPTDGLGYQSLRFAFHPGESDLADGDRFSVTVAPGRAVSLLEDNRVDMARREWQVVEIPMRLFGSDEPYSGVHFTGNFSGVIYFDRVELAAAPFPPQPVTAVSEEQIDAIPQAFTLHHSYPNPFNSETTIRYALPVADQVELAIYNLAGQVVAKLVRETRPAGRYTLRWDGRDDQNRSLASGVYLCRLQSSTQTQMRKLLLLR